VPIGDLGADDMRGIWASAQKRDAVREMQACRDAGPALGYRNA